MTGVERIALVQKRLNVNGDLVEQAEYYILHAKANPQFRASSLVVAAAYLAAEIDRIDVENK